MMPREQRKDFEDLEASLLYCPTCKRAMPVRKRLLPGAARQGNFRLHLHRVWLCGGEEGAAVAETGSMVENLRDSVAEGVNWLGKN